MIHSSDEDTIVAIATPPGEGGIGIVRLSGKNAVAIAETMFAAASKQPIAKQKSHTAVFGHLVDRFEASKIEVVDEALVLFMRAPKSYTGEDMVELQTHGGPAILQKAVAMALREGARLAEKGEFTKRAFLNGHLDLIQAEGVLNLIQSKTELARRLSSAELHGRLSGQMKRMKESLVDILANL